MNGARLKRYARSAGGWILAVAIALLVGKSVQWARDGEAPPRSAPAPAAKGVTLADGGPTLLYFWASWCGVCRVQGPVVEAVAAEAPGCARVVPIEETGNAEAFEAYGVRLLPTMVVVDDEGRVAKRFLGFTTKWQLLSALRDAGSAC